MKGSSYYLSLFIYATIVFLYSVSPSRVNSQRIKVVSSILPQHLAWNFVNFVNWFLRSTVKTKHAMSLGEYPLYSAPVKRSQSQSLRLPIKDAGLKHNFTPSRKISKVTAKIFLCKS